MATVTTKLTITSSNLLSHALSISSTTSTTASHTTGLARAKVTSTDGATASGQETLYTASEYQAPAYLYVKNTSTSATSIIYVYADDAADSTILNLKGGEFAFLPTNAGVSLKAYTNTAGTVVEYMVFGNEV